MKRPTVVVLLVFALAFVALAFAQYARQRAHQLPPNVGHPNSVDR